MRRSKPSSGGRTSGRPGKSSGSGPKKSFSKNDKYPKSAGAKKPFRKERSDSDKPERKAFSEGSGERPKRYGSEGGSSERKPFTRSAKPGERSPSRSRDGGRPSSGERSRGRDERKPFDADKSGSERRERPASERRVSDGTSRPGERSSSRPRDTERVTYKEKGPESESRRSFDGDRAVPEKREKPAYRSKTSGPSFNSAGKNKRKRKGDDEKSFSSGEEGGGTGKLKSRFSTHQNDSPRSYGENRFQKPRDEKKDKRNAERISERRSSGEKPERQWNRKEDHKFYGEKKKSAPMPKMSEDGSVRLNKFIANAGICSRREADELIEAGVVSVNGKVVTEMGYQVMPGDSVKYNNELLRGERLVYILLNKPKDFITTTDDPEDRKTVMGLIAKACKERVYPVGRLDRNTTGVLLFTNDGDLAKTLTHPSFQVHKVYQAELDRSLKHTDMEQIMAGITLDDGFIKPDEVVYTSSEKDVIGMELHSGKNRIVRRIFEHLGYEVKKLDRVIFAGLTKKDLPRGRWRFLTDMEVASLKMNTGKKKVKSK